jgi:hypothetical protein
MKTEDLVSLLSTGTEAVDLRLVSRRWLLALAGGASIAFLLTAGLLKLNPTLLQEASKPMFWIRESYCAVLAALGFVAVVRLARPGSPLGVAPMGIPVAVIATWVLAAATLVMAAPQNRAPLILGHTAAVCPFLIALLATPLWIALLWVMRSLAPTRLRWAGAASGFTAGSAVFRNLVPARYADPRCHRRVARSAVAALVARPAKNHLTVTFCFVPTN